MSPDESFESRLAVLETRMQSADKRMDGMTSASEAILVRVDKAIEEIGNERLDMAQQRGELKQFKNLVPWLTGVVGFLGGTLVTVFVAYQFHV
jgi:hypothetical protein